MGADVSGLERGMTAAQRATQRTGAAMSRNITSAAQSGTLNVNKLGGAFLSLASQATGVNPAVARLTNVLGAFAIGGPVMIGVLAGITAVSAGWNLYTKDAREATAATQKLIDKLSEAYRAEQAGTVVGMQKTGAELAEALKARLPKVRTATWTGVQTSIGNADTQEVDDALDALRKHNQLMRERMTLDQALEGISTRTAEQIKAANDKVTEALGKRLDAQVALVMAMERAQNFGFDRKAIGVGTGAGEILPTGMVVNLDRMKATLKDLPDLVRLTTDRVFELGADAEIVTDKMASFAASGIDAFTSFAVGAGGSMKEFVDQALKDLGRLLLKLLIVEGLKTAIRGGTFGAGNFAFALMDQLTARAAGGPVRAGGAYMVGERGPEMFVPSSSGTIVPNGGGGAAALLAALGPYPRGPMTPSEWARESFVREGLRIVIKENGERG